MPTSAPASPSLPELLLPAALVERDWLGADRLAAAASAASWVAIVRRAVPDGSAGPDGPPPHDPGHERWLDARLALGGHPLAAFRAASDASGRADWRVDPVHLHVGRDHLVLTDPAALALDAAQARALADSIAPLLADDGLALEVATPSRWYLRETDPRRPLRLRTRALIAALGRSIDAWQPAGEDARRWRRLLNEIQMTWHAHPVNDARTGQGLPSVNSLWIEGRCPSPTLADSPGGCAAARLAAAAQAPGDAGAAVARGAPGVAGEGVVESRAQPLRVDGPDGAAIVFDRRLLDAHFGGDPARWLEAWRALDAGVFAAIVRAEPPWSAGARVVVTGDEGWRALRVAPRADWRFWRRVDATAPLGPPPAGSSR